MLISATASNLHAQEAVQVGAGSYAVAPPADALDGAKKMEGRELFVVEQGDRALPTNKWWTQLLVTPFARSLWAYPMKVDTSDQGIDLFFPTRWQPPGNDPASEFPLLVSAANFKPTAAKAKDWSDWLVSFRMAGDDASQYIDVTLGEGMPCAWFEFAGLQPTLSLRNAGQAKYFDRTGKPITGNVKGDCVGFEIGGRRFGIFAPDGTSFTLTPDGPQIQFAGGNGSYLVVCPLLAAEDIAVVAQHAFAIPRKTAVSWEYSPEKATVKTTWTIEAEALKGTNTQVIQGWLPHHWRNTTNDLKLSPAFTYLSPRGPLKCGIGSTFTIDYPFNGIVPNLPAPQVRDEANPYDPARMKWYLDTLAANPKYGEDTYWGGKDILRMGQDILMSQQIGDADLQQKFIANLRAAMVDWFTYEPGETAHYFMWYPKWRGLVGKNFSYGSEEFNDHHFHYGYFTQAAALLAAHDPQFAKDYGPMATLVAKEYANWDRADTRFPFMRNFDLWAGHGWAGGTSSPGGNNQESSSEDAQSFAGLIMLGQALGDKDMLAAGAMGYATESRALMEYWFDPHGDVFPPEWPHKATGMVWGGGKVFGTYFTGDASWVYAIQWIPASPALSYLVRDPAFARQMYDHMHADVRKQDKETTIKSFGPALGSVMLGYVLMYDPAWAAAQLDDLWNEPGDKIARDAKEMAIMYYMAHSMRGLGLVDWACHTSSPTSMVFLNKETNTRTAVVWNPHAAEQSVTVYENGKPIGEITAKPQALTSAVVK
jgi:endoglucanase Acf2